MFAGFAGLVRGTQLEVDFDISMIVAVKNENWADVAALAKIAEMWVQEITGTVEEIVADLPLNVLTNLPELELLGKDPTSAARKAYEAYQVAHQTMAITSAPKPATPVNPVATPPVVATTDTVDTNDSDAIANDISSETPIPGN